MEMCMRPKVLVCDLSENESGKCNGASRKPLAEVYSLERPVARHFVLVIVKASRVPLHKW